MTDEVTAAPQEVEAPEVVTPEQDQASEATENTEGQDQQEGQPAEDEAEAEAEDKSASKARRERRKAAKERLRQEAQEAQDRAERAERELARLKGAESQPPRIDDFQDHDEYLAELSAYKAEQRMRARELETLEREAETSKNQTQEMQRRQMEAARDNWAAQADEARSRYSDFDAVVQAPDVPITPHMAHLLGMSDNGADVAYYLGTNKEQAAQIASMPPQQLAGAMQMLEHFVSRQTPRPRTTSQAPDPVKPVRPKATATKKVSDMSMAEYAAARKAGKI
jgi:hypothetical protein